MKNLLDTKLFLLDMDGTFYLGGALLRGAVEFLRRCDECGIPYMFLTNNSSKSAQDYILKLAAMGVQISERQMITSGSATLQYLEQNGISKEILLIGTQSLEDEFEQSGYETAAQEPKAVVLGFDTTLNYEKLCALCDTVRSGVPYIATHPDFNCPVEGGYIPDIGATIAYVEASAGRLPDVVVGKPNKFIAMAASQRAGVSLCDVCMVGDRLYTDIAMGKAGLSTALVLSGETDRAMLENSDIKPDFVYEGLWQMAEVLSESGGV